MLRRLVTSPMKVTVKRWLRARLRAVPPLHRALGRRRLPPAIRDLAWPWQAAIYRTQQAAPPTYAEMIAEHVRGSFQHYMMLPLYSIPVLIRARRIVELGSAFTYYPDTYPGGSPWRISRSGSEGLVSTRCMLAASRHLDGVGVASTVTSVDLRTPDADQQRRITRLFSDLGVLDLWRPVFGVDSIAWLQSQAGTEPIDFALVDSNHTFAHTSAELEALAPLMAETAVILVDNCYTAFYGHGGAPDVAEEARRGSKFGAVQEFIAAHPEWTPRWTSEGMMLLYRGQVDLSR